MKIDFRKISKEPKTFEFEMDGIRLKGSIRHKEHQLYEFKATMTGDVLLTCDKTGLEYTKNLNETLDFFLSDGLFEVSSDDPLEVVEFFDGFIDIAVLLENEVESIRLEYHTLEED